MKLIFVFLIQLIILGAYAQSDQTVVITGKVTDQYNEPLTGVTILNSGSGTVPLQPSTSNYMNQPQL